VNLFKLRISIIGTLAVIITISTLFFTVILNLLGVFNIITLGLFVVFFNILQWLFAPHLIGAIYRIKKVSRSEEPELFDMVEHLSNKSGIKTPDIMVSKIPLPNAFAYGSPLTGNRVAVTTELLNTLNSKEIEAVIGHELGHLKHRDVQVMMFVSILPALFYYIGYSLMWSSAFNRRDQRGNSGLFMMIGFASVIIFWVLNLFTLFLSRTREYFADNHSVSIVENGAQNLAVGLVKIDQKTKTKRKSKRNTHNLGSVKTLFISDPDNSSDKTNIFSGMNENEIVNKYLNRKITSAEKLVEIFSTHPNITKRLRALRESS
jgi:heat shock protein HtpX